MGGGPKDGVGPTGGAAGRGEKEASPTVGGRWVECSGARVAPGPDEAGVEGPDDEWAGGMRRAAGLWEAPGPDAGGGVIECDPVAECRPNPGHSLRGMRVTAAR